ncbi:hypothetical protein SPRG_03627 [Saprolegnia parasitica CBS 223.65]|uniref:Macro domain-containing protein n=1 Tax=Saprolegnia parasitica (strain CBS 223.65) TaxID=695850 RepID=A0A067CM18_SAPPC|nr:hypothetical protein SPRG_03627 [Saprolegnia parasitica CBS 223.65]KDO31709.1 hypothetical protein SPRG_03627 [Saprolegnia parasitica CBS 223.65]|eukprot:XP_012197592.1 hypothetical protein SPRG_03627 [Saprolegnia parasitica CBS 223.65]
MEPSTFQLSPMCQLIVSLGDITRWEGDAIVNAANELMLGGSGVDGAIHKAAGPKLLQACMQVPEVRRHVRCPVGEARITEAFCLRAKYVIHTAGPVYRRNLPVAKLLGDAYWHSLELGHAYGCKTIAFPAISCGVYGYPLESAAQTALETCLEFAEAAGENAYDAIEFVLFNQATHDAWLAAASKLAMVTCDERGKSTCKKSLLM